MVSLDTVIGSIHRRGRPQGVLSHSRGGQTFHLRPRSGSAGCSCHPLASRTSVFVANVWAAAFASRARISTLDPRVA